MENMDTLLKRKNKILFEKKKQRMKNKKTIEKKMKNFLIYLSI